MRLMLGKVTAEWIIIPNVLKACEPTSSTEDLEAIEISLTQGCPVNFNWEQQQTKRVLYGMAIIQM